MGILEKRRAEYSSSKSPLALALDEIPKIGHFLEVEGMSAQIHELVPKLAPAMSAVPERRNYSELFLAHEAAQGKRIEEIEGASFS